MADPGLKLALREDLTTAIKQRDSVAMDSIRMVLSAISMAEVAGKQAKELSDDDVVAVIVREVKKREEAAAAFRAGDREASAAEEDAQAVVLRRYLPKPLSSEELDALVAAAVAQAQSDGLEGGRAMGRVMAALKEPTAGRVEGSVVADAVKSALGMRR